MAWPLGQVHTRMKNDEKEFQLDLWDRFQTPIPGKELVQLKPGEDPEYFLRTFERIAECALWPKHQWPKRLAPLLSEEARLIYQALPSYAAEDYDQLKDALLRHLSVSEEVNRRKFRSVSFLSEAGLRAVASRLRELGKRWLKPESRSSEEIVEIIVVEQFIHILPGDAKEWLSHHQVQSLESAVRLIEGILAGEHYKHAAGGLMSSVQTIELEKVHVTKDSPVFPNPVSPNIKNEKEKCPAEKLDLKKRTSDCPAFNGELPLNVKCEEEVCPSKEPEPGESENITLDGSATETVPSESIKDEDRVEVQEEMESEGDISVVPVIIKNEEAISDMDHPDMELGENSESPTDEDEVPLTADANSASPAETVDILSRKRHAVADENQLDSLEIERNELRTRLQTKWAVDLFKGWLKESKRDVSFEKLSSDSLCQLLRTFYAEVRNAKGEEYHIQSLVCVRAGINRYLNSPPFNRAINIMHDPSFISANNVFLGIIKRKRREAKHTAERHGAITRDDLIKLRSSPIFGVTEPTTLLNKVWFEVQLHLARRGREGLRVLPPDAFAIVTDEDGHEYATPTYEASKYQNGNSERGKASLRGRMYAQPKSPSCPVAALKLYISKMPPGAPCFYLQPRKLSAHQAAREKVWYTVRPLGKNALGNFMKNLSVQACLSKMYTNHCIRTTTVQLLSDAGLETREIMAVTGHRCASSVKNYWKANEKQRSCWSGILSSAGVELPTLSTPPLQQSGTRPIAVRKEVDDSQNPLWLTGPTSHNDPSSSAVPPPYSYCSFNVAGDVQFKLV
ncbi:uncharacterized protein [Pleurodeles waltl]